MPHTPARKKTASPAASLWHWFTPTYFRAVSGRVTPIALVLLLVTLPTGLAYAFFLSPPDYLQGETVRIMYIHVPSAWLALALYGAIAVASGITLTLKLPMAGHFATAASPVGACFTAIALISGSLWGKPTWGTYWVWDARLTSMLVLFFFYLAHSAMTQAFKQQERGQQAASILAIVGALNLPIIKWSVEWWHTLHQPESISFINPSSHIDISMLIPLGLMTVALFSYATIVITARMKLAILQQKWQSLLYQKTRNRS
ncbi:MAG: cytochrome c biogenesis protein CcsA [Alphaproteobacteria bacterium GM202ARS2]|nr:cytochrome c biogenesis protein CcsA [Alphaproteobacteria bacterium GM202ARS2]